jgi:protocatechuate 3,4-dioxygenase beta subunit
MPQGSVFLLTGVVMRQNGTVLPNSLVELWQADGFGRYAHRLDQNTHDQSTHDQRAQARDPHFAGFGRVLTNAQGRFTFRTLKPAPYPGRTQHVHIRVVHPQAGTLTTQLYFPANPNNARDFLFSRLTRADQEALLLHWTTPQSATPPIAHCRLVV